VKLPRQLHSPIVIGGLGPSRDKSSPPGKLILTPKRLSNYFAIWQTLIAA
jgi:hypothetical protein